MKRVDDLMSEDIKRKYEETLELTYQEFRRLDLELAAEVERAKSRLQKLQDAKKAVALVYEGVCARLGLNNGSGLGSRNEQSDTFQDQFGNEYVSHGEQSDPFSDQFSDADGNPSEQNNPFPEQ